MAGPAVPSIRHPFHVFSLCCKKRIARKVLEGKRCAKAKPKAGESEISFEAYGCRSGASAEPSDWGPYVPCSRPPHRGPYRREASHRSEPALKPSPRYSLPPPYSNTFALPLVLVSLWHICIYNLAVISVTFSIFYFIVIKRKEGVFMYPLFDYLIAC